MAIGPFGHRLRRRAASFKVNPSRRAAPGRPRPPLSELGLGLSRRLSRFPIPFPQAWIPRVRHGNLGTQHPVSEPASRKSQPGALLNPRRLRASPYKWVFPKAQGEPTPKTPASGGDTPRDIPGHTPVSNHSGLGQNLGSSDLSGTMVGISKELSGSFLHMFESDFKSRNSQQVHLAACSVPHTCSWEQCKRGFPRLVLCCSPKN